MTDVTLDAAPTREQLYAEVQLFYARHMQQLDSGQAKEWAAGFTEDAVFAPEHRPHPVVGREALTEAVRTTHEGLVAAGEQRRHWHGMVDVRADDDGTVHVQCYAIILGTVVGGEPQIKMACVCRDTLVRVDGELRISVRRVTKDGVVPPS